MQKRNGNVILLILFFSLLIVSCNNKIDALNDSGMGEVVFDISTSFTKAEATDASLNVDDFKIELLNYKGILFKRWKTFAEYKALEDKSIPLNAYRMYTVRALYGDSTAVGFDAFYFKGETKVQVQPQEVIEVDVVCSMANAKIGVSFGELMSSEYENMIAKVSNKYGALIFTSDNINENGYIPAEPLTVNLEMTRKGDGKKFYFKKTDIEIDPGDYKMLRLDTKTVSESDVRISLVIDDKTEDITQTIDLPSFALPLDAPIFNLAGFDSNGVAGFTEGVSPEESNVSIVTEAGMVSCRLDISSSYLSSLDFPKTIDFVNMDEASKTLLKQYKLYYPENIAGNTLTGFDFKDFVKIFKYDKDVANNTHAFTFTVTDLLGKETVKVIKFVPAEADKSINDISAGDIWAKKVYFTMNTSNGDVSRLFPQVSVDGGKSWTNPTYNTIAINGTDHKVVVTGLNAASDYSFRAAYNNYGSSTVKNITTEAAAQVPNSDMESWTEGRVKSYDLIGDTYQYTYYPWANEASKVWDTNNAATTKTSGTPAYLEKKCFPMVSFMPGRTGGKAAQIMAIAVNGGNTNGTSLSDAVPGELFIGTYGGSRNTGFGSRPSKMKFWFKYDIRTDDNNSSDTYRATVVLYNGADVIGEGKLEYNSSADVNNWTEANVDIKYSNTEKKATAIYMQFLQSTKDKPVYNMNVSITYGETRTAGVHGGSVLTVDDIELIYE